MLFKKKRKQHEYLEALKEEIDSRDPLGKKQINDFKWTLSQNKNLNPTLIELETEFMLKHQNLTVSDSELFLTVAKDYKIENIKELNFSGFVSYINNSKKEDDNAHYTNS